MNVIPPNKIMKRYCVLNNESCKSEKFRTWLKKGKIEHNTFCSVCKIDFAVKHD